jgi:predicted transcriptional regulator
MNLVNDDKLSEDKKLELFKDSFQKLTKVTLDIVINSIYKIDSVTGSVVDLEFIKEFMDKCDRKIFNMVRKKLEELKEKNTVKPMRMKATEEMIAAGSAEEIEVPIVFDPSTFFV